jgi:hypothetical protein
MVGLVQPENAPTVLKIVRDGLEHSFGYDETLRNLPKPSSKSLGFLILPEEDRSGIEIEKGMAEPGEDKKREEKFY